MSVYKLVHVLWKIAVHGIISDKMPRYHYICLPVLALAMLPCHNGVAILTVSDAYACMHNFSFHIILTN